jgi:hypothetical protein
MLRIAPSPCFSIILEKVPILVEFLKITMMYIGVAILYGIVHDQFTARICIEYFTVFHPPVFGTQSPTLLGIGWGILATWWVAAILGMLLAISARVGTRAPLTAARLVCLIGRLLFFMPVCATVSGIAGFVLTRHQAVSPPEWVAWRLSTPSPSRFMADWWAHTASYATGLVGGIGLCVKAFQMRKVSSPNARGR